MLTLYTTAHPCYDGFGTKQVATHGKYYGDDVREVETDEAYHTWQLMRYQSGMNLVSEDLAEIQKFQELEN